MDKVCNRKGCVNTGNRRSNAHGTICEDCFEELLDLGFMTDIYLFMCSEKGSVFGSDREKTHNLFSSIFVEGF